MSRTRVVISWVLQLVVAGILLQTLFFKFTGAEESRFIFTTLGVEPIGRYAAGAIELAAVALLLVPRTVAIGAILAVCVISGALLGHLTRLGIEVRGDGGLLFALACVVFAGGSAVALLRRDQLRIALRRSSESDPPVRAARGR